MIAKIFIPLLLMVSAVAADPIGPLCTRLITQFNLLHKLAPLEVDVIFPPSPSRWSLIGNAVYRIGSVLSLPENCCSSTPVNNSTKRHIIIKVNNDRAYIISPSTIYTANEVNYILELDVEISGNGSIKTVAVVHFSIDNQKIYQFLSEIDESFKRYINDSLKNSLKKKLQEELNTRFYAKNRVEIRSNLVRDLTINVFQVAAQDF